MDKKKKVKVVAKIDVNLSMEKAKKLIVLLNEANSLANELAKSLKNLEIDFKV